MCIRDRSYGGLIRGRPWRIPLPAPCTIGFPMRASNCVSNLQGTDRDEAAHQMWKARYAEAAEKENLDKVIVVSQPAPEFDITKQTRSQE